MFIFEKQNVFHVFYLNLEHEGVAYAIELEFEAIRGHKSEHSLATGPVIAEPFISPLLFTMTPALSSKYMKTPSRLLNGLRCLTTTAGITYWTILPIRIVYNHGGDNR